MMALFFLPHAHGDDARAAAAGDAVFVGTGALAEAVLRHRKHELLPGAQLGIAFGRQRRLLDAVLGILGHLLGPVSASSPAARRAALACLR